MRLQIDKLGKVSITVEKEYWNINKSYDKLTIVPVKDSFSTYISRKDVPSGIVLTDTDYWIKFSSLEEDIILDYHKHLNELNNELGKRIDKIDTSYEHATHSGIELTHNDREKLYSVVTNSEGHVIKKIPHTPYKLAKTYLLFEYLLPFKKVVENLPTDYTNYEDEDVVFHLPTSKFYVYNSNNKNFSYEGTLANMYNVTKSSGVRGRTDKLYLNAEDGRLYSIKNTVPDTDVATNYKLIDYDGSESISKDKLDKAYNHAKEKGIAIQENNVIYGVKTNEEGHVTEKIDYTPLNWLKSYSLFKGILPFIAIADRVPVDIEAYKDYDVIFNTTDGLFYGLINGKFTSQGTLMKAYNIDSYRKIFINTRRDPGLYIKDIHNLNKLEFHEPITTTELNNILI